jgi:SRSO17 transposase
MDGEGADRFEAFVDALTEVFGRGSGQAAEDYCMGLLTPAERKSVEPLAAVTAP